MIDQVCKVLSINPLAKDIWEMTFSADQLVKIYKGAGQFIEILGDKTWDHPLRRPMSISGITDSTMSIIFKVMGQMTSRFSSLKVNDEINVLGPLGNTFSHPSENETAILIGGGVGLAPIMNFLNELKSINNHVLTIIGARTKDEHHLDHDPCNGMYLTTDDGSIGDHGTVMPTLDRIINTVKYPKLYACGPEPMLKAVQQFGLTHDIPTELSVESYMGCGVGLCQGCVLKREGPDFAEDSYQKKYTVVCKDGPVYNAKEIHFD
ncbi:MAG: dihydroorotate dehydrogenase electron transfer subunit [Candidatus Marinimicrobia bacterium]|nr:dihydroorotate dehydrogenase electron transfer subunit [Candidatus Neomarinimicrobiota bacterium]